MDLNNVVLVLALTYLALFLLDEFSPLKRRYFTLILAAVLGIVYLESRNTRKEKFGQCICRNGPNPNMVKFQCDKSANCAWAPG